MGRDAERDSVEPNREIEPGRARMLPYQWNQPKPRLHVRRAIREGTVYDTKGSTLVFPSSEGNPMNARKPDPPRLRAGSATSELRRIRFHDVRHTALPRLLGDSSPIATLSICSHTIPKPRADLTDRLADLF